LRRDALIDGVAGVTETEPLGAVGGGRITVFSGVVGLGKGVLVVGGYRRRLVDILNGNDDALGDPNYNPWH
jgi:hypothetical protein